jgi:hypothetical protein
MATISVDALRGITNIRNRPYTMYSGYMTPNQLIQFCDVPSYELSQSHVSIANGLKQAPINNWQRPLGIKRLEKIAASIDRALIGTDNSKDSLMANPVLIGRSDRLNQVGVDLQINNKTISIGGTHHPIPDLWSLEFTASANHKPLWILDGQHRIHGMGNSPYVVDEAGAQVFNGSIAQDEVIPVVFIIDAGYQPKFLAKIFTEVTTESKPMDQLHGDWMQYAFELGEYNNKQEALLSMKVVIQLASIQDIDGSANPFFDSIKFNPHHPITPVSAFRKMSSKKLREEIMKNFYYSYDGPNGSDRVPPDYTPGVPQTWPTAEELATCIVRFYRACIQSDALSGTTSKLFGPNDGSELLADMFISEFFKYIALPQNQPMITGNSTSDWVTFLQDADRIFHAADWSLPLVTVGGNEKNHVRKASNKAAQKTFENLFCNPALFAGNDPATWLQGPGNIYIEHCPLGGAFSNATAIGQEHLAGGGASSIPSARAAGHKMVRFVSLSSSQATIVKVERKINANTWQQHPTKTAATLTPGNLKSDVFRVTTLCYTESSEQTNTYTILS